MALRIRQSLLFAGTDPPVEYGVHPEVPDRHQHNRQEVGDVEIDVQPGVKHMKEKNGQNNSNPTDGVELHKATYDTRFCCVDGLGVFEGPQFIPQKVI